LEDNPRTCPEDAKMYNRTCDIMDNLGASDAWVRECPEGVQSCYWGEGKYLRQSEYFT